MTEAGRLLAEHGRRLLSEYEGALNVFSEGPMRGLVRMMAPVVFGQLHVTPMVASFLEQHPLTTFELQLHRNRGLIEERLHLGIRIGA